MSTIATNRNGKITADQHMIDGVQKFLSQFASLPVGSQTVTPADIVRVFQERLDTGKAVLAADAARIAAIKADKDKRVQTAAFTQSFRRMVQGMFSQSPDTLAAFGLKPLKAAKKTVETKATAVAKSKATRKARNTMGKKQKKAVKGTVPTAKSGAAPAPETQPTKPNA
jgi:hypothetical protein